MLRTFTVLSSKNTIQYMAVQYEILPCPFCNKGEISCLYFPSVWSQKRTVTGSLPGKKSVSRSKENWIIKSGCSNCGKTQEEVEEKLKDEDII